MKNQSIENDTSSILNNSLLIEKLKASSKNRLITKKYKILAQNQTSTAEEFNNLYIDSNYKSEPTNNNNNNEEFQLKWNNIVKQAKVDAMHLDLNTSGVFNLHKDDHSMLSDNLEEINNFIEETYQVVLTENMFLRQGIHSILPFILLPAKGIHRMCLSDYEIKMVYRTFQKKLKNKRIDGMDYYKIGLINFYSGKYYISYKNFKIAYELRKNETTIIKWLAFNIIILLFATNNKLKINNLKYDDNMSVRETQKEEESFIFKCCSHRKSRTKFNYKSNDSVLFTDENINEHKVFLCQELEEYIKFVINDSRHEIEGW